MGVLVTVALAAALLGSTLPDIVVTTKDGREVRLGEAVRERPVLLVTPENRELKPPDGVGLVIAKEAATLIGAGRAALVDTGRIARIVSDDPVALASTTKMWVAGGAIYKVQCARCHGVDGRDDHYPGIKKLDGIGNRLLPEQILERTIRSGSVDLTPFDKAAREALSIYVAGL